MALQKSKTIKGFSAEYWRILQINCNFDRGDAVVTFGLYKDKATRDEDALAVLDQYTVNLGSSLLDTPGKSDTVKNINLKQAYTAFKSLALLESEKPEEEQNDSLLWFADVQDII